MGLGKDINFTLTVRETACLTENLK